MNVHYDKRKFVRELATVLTSSPAIQAIDFYIGTGDRLHVTGSGLIRIGGMLQSGRIDVRVDDAAVQAGTPANTSAKGGYDALNDRMCFPASWVRSEESSAAFSKYALEPVQRDPNRPVFTDTPERRATLVHEAAHAWIDLRGIRVYHLRDEIAGRLAAAIYLHHSGELKSLMTREFATDAAVWKDADEVARREKLYERLGVRLFRQDLHPLLRTIRWLYNMPLTERSCADGID